MSSLSRKADVSFRTVKRLWKDPYHPVNTTTIEKLAKALEVKSGELLEDQEKTWNRIFDQPTNS